MNLPKKLSNTHGNFQDSIHEDPHPRWERVRITLILICFLLNAYQEMLWRKIIRRLSKCARLYMLSYQVLSFWWSEVQQKATLLSHKLKVWKQFSRVQSSIRLWKRLCSINSFCYIFVPSKRYGEIITFLITFSTYRTQLYWTSKIQRFHTLTAVPNSVIQAIILIKYSSEQLSSSSTLSKFPVSSLLSPQMYTVNHPHKILLSFSRVDAWDYPIKFYSYKFLC